MKKKIITFFCLFLLIFSSKVSSSIIGELIGDVVEAVVEEAVSTAFVYTSLTGTFKPYPYYTEKNTEDGSVASVSGSPFIVYDGTGSSTKIFISSALVYNTLLGLGNTSRLDGYFWRFFGPYVENQAYWDVDGSLTGMPGKCNGICYLGGQFTLIKTNPFTWQTVCLFGLNYGVLESNCFRLTNVFKCYPGARLELEDRLSFMFNKKVLLDNEVLFGVQMDRIQLFAVWNYGFDIDEKKTAYHQWGGGLKLCL